MLSCKETSKLISEGLDHSLPLHKRFFMHLHLRMCLTCGYYRKQITALKKIFTHYPDPDKSEQFSSQALSEDFCQQLKDIIKQQP